MKMKSTPRPFPQSNAMSSLYNSSLSITYGSVKSNNTDSTTNILLVNGFLATNIRLISSVFPSKEPTIGSVKYPQVDSQVIIIHPTGDLNSGFVIPAPLDIRDDQVKDDLFDQGDKTILPGGWEYFYNKETGKTEFKNGDFFDLIVDPDTKVVSLVDFKENKIITNSNGMLFEDLNGNTVSMETGKVLINGNLEILQ